MRARILVTDGETPAALAVVRSLSLAGHRVHVLAHARHASAAASRAATAIRTPDPVREPTRWMEHLVKVTSRGGFDVLLPISDTALLLVDLIRHRIPGRIALAMPPGDVLRQSQDKPGVLARAGALGIPVLPCRVGREIFDAPLPAVVKPARSRSVGPDRVMASTAIVVADKSRLVGAVRERTQAGLGAYVEPWIPGEGRGVFLLMHDGRVLAHFAHRRIREASPLGGPSAVAESVPQDPLLFDYSVALARDLEIDGPFMAEFRGVEGEFVLLEVNARYWGSLALAVASGVDFPALHVAAVLGNPRPGPESYQTGVRVRNLAFDLKRTALAWCGSAAGSTIEFPGRLPALLDLLTGRAPGMISKHGDPAAGRAHLLRLITKAVKCE